MTTIFGILFIVLSAYLIALSQRSNPKIMNVRMYQEVLFAFGIASIVASLFCFYRVWLTGFDEFLINVVNYLNSHK